MFAQSMSFHVIKKNIGFGFTKYYIPKENKVIPNEHQVLDIDKSIYPISFFEVYVQFSFKLNSLLILFFVIISRMINFTLIF
jgi:hypothetical protein